MTESSFNILFFFVKVKSKKQNQDETEKAVYIKKSGSSSSSPPIERALAKVSGGEGLKKFGSTVCRAFNGKHS